MSRVIIPPMAVDIDGARVYILEVTENDWIDEEKHYLVTCFVEYKGYRSRVFTIDAKTNAELLAKLRTEVAKMKLLIMTGQTHLFTKA